MFLCQKDKERFLILLLTILKIMTMKRFILISSLGLMIGMFNINKSEAQIHVHVSINIDIQPAWGPSGYDYAEYYYIPELNIYYDVTHRLFYYLDRMRWVSAMFLPVEYSYYDFYSLYKVVINNVFEPWRYNRNHRHLYHRYCYNYTQVPVYFMRDHIYYRARNNCHGWVEPRYMPRNDGRPRSRDYAINIRNGRISQELRSASANEALRNNRSSSRASNGTGNTGETAGRMSSSSRERSSSTNAGRTVSRSSETTTRSSSSRSAATSESRTDTPKSTNLEARDNKNVTSTQASRNSASSESSSRSSSSRSSSSSASTRSRGSSSSGSSVADSNSKNSNSGVARSRNSSRSERSKE
jgi:hypothetical protein